MGREATVICFPHEFREVAVKKDVKKIGDMWADVLQERYLDNGSELVVVKLVSDFFVFPAPDLPLDKFDRREISTQMNHRYHSQLLAIESKKDDYYEHFDKVEFADFADVVKQLNPQKYSKIRIGGFQATDCVHKLSKRVFVENPNTLVDAELTNHFPLHALARRNWHKSLIDNDFVPGSYDPQRAYNRLESQRYNAYIQSEEMDAMRRLFAMPHFGNVKTRTQANTAMTEYISNP